MKTAIVLLLLTHSTQLFAADWADGLSGPYTVHSGVNTQEQEYRYLNCYDGDAVAVSVEDSNMIIEGLKNSPLVLQNINEPAKLYSGPIISVQQRRTTVEISDSGVKTFKSQVRECQPLIGKLGCVGAKWRTHTVVVVAKVQVENESFQTIEVMYQPFAQHPAESCYMIQ